MKRVYKIAIKRVSSPKHFLEVTTGIERLQQNALDRLRFSDLDSEQAQIPTQSNPSESF